MEELPYSQKLFNFPIKNIQTLIQPEVKEEIQFVEQYVSEVLDFSSQYGSDTSISYTAYNLTGKPSKFPDYGDFPQAFVMVLNISPFLNLIVKVYIFCGTSSSNF